MSPIPPAPKIYHITHVGNLERIIVAGGLLSDSRCLNLGLDVTTVGMSSIKRRRLEQLQVTCHPGTKVGEYVPFYFCLVPSCSTSSTLGIIPSWLPGWPAPSSISRVTSPRRWRGRMRTGFAGPSPIVTRALPTPASIRIGRIFARGMGAVTNNN